MINLLSFYSFHLFLQPHVQTRIDANAVLYYSYMLEHQHNKFFRLPTLVFFLSGAVQNRSNSS